MPTVKLELLFPLSRIVDPKAKGRITVVEDISSSETVGSFLTRLTDKYPGLQGVFDRDKQEIKPMVLLVVNDNVVISDAGLDIELKDGEYLCLLPQHVGG